MQNSCSVSYLNGWWWNLVWVYVHSTINICPCVHCLAQRCPLACLVPHHCEHVRASGHLACDSQTGGRSCLWTKFMLWYRILGFAHDQLVILFLCGFACAVLGFNCELSTPRHPSVSRWKPHPEACAAAGNMSMFQKRPKGRQQLLEETVADAHGEFDKESFLPHCTKWPRGSRLQRPEEPPEPSCTAQLRLLTGWPAFGHTWPGCPCCQAQPQGQLHSSLASTWSAGEGASPHGHRVLPNVCEVHWGIQLNV